MPSKILIAEDEPDIQDMLVFMFEHEGFTVVAANNGAEAFESAQRENPDLVLMDARMPYVDGYTATRLIREDPALHDVPVIFVSVRGLPTDRQKEAAAGASGHVNKPFAPDELIQQVKTALASRI